MTSILRIIQKVDGNRFWNTMIRHFKIFKTKANTLTNSSLKETSAHHIVWA